MDEVRRRLPWEALVSERETRGKQEMRKKLAALSFAEKVKILEKLRDRELAIAAAGLRKKPVKSGGKRG